MTVTWRAAAFAAGALIWGSAVIAQETPAPSAPSTELQTNQLAPSVEAQAQGTVPRVNGAVEGDANIQGNLDARTNHAPLDGADRNLGADANGRAALGVSFRSGASDLTISSVAPGSPAARIGLQPGDRIVSVNGRPYADLRTFMDASSQLPLNQDAEIVYVRGGIQHRVSARLAPWDSVYAQQFHQPQYGQYGQPHTTMRPSFDDGAIPPGAQPAEFQVGPGCGYGAANYAPYGAVNCPCGDQQYHSFSNCRGWGRRGWRRGC